MNSYKNKMLSLLLGKRLEDSKLSSEKFNTLWGIPVFASDAISSVSYAGEEILLVLVPVLGMASFKFFLPVVGAIIGLLAILVFCYRQTIDAYPQGGGAYIVANENLGEKYGLVAGAALIIGYILTVAVSSCAGAAAITSAFPELNKYKALIAIFLILILAWGNLRGLRESAVLFGLPTYVFILTMIVTIVVGLIRFASGNYTPQETEIAVSNAGDTLIFLILRAFASGCTALTGVEAVSNGVPNFKDPAPVNAKRVLYAMAGFVALVFFGVSALVNMYHIIPNDQETVISILAATIYGKSSIMYYVVQIMTVVILSLAANTAFAGLPLLLAIMAKDGYLPRQLVTRGFRLNYSNGILILLVTSALLVLMFNGSQHYLLPLYASGVFISFLLSQLGMVVHWVKNKGPKWHIKAAINGFGTVITAITLVIIIIMKFTSGAWVTLLMIVILVLVMFKIKDHYRSVAEDLRIDDMEMANSLIHDAIPGKVIVPIQDVHRSFIKTLNCALSCGFNEVEFYSVCDSEARAQKLKEKLDKLRIYSVPVYFNYDVTELRNTNEVLIRHIEEEVNALPPHQYLTVMMGVLVTEKNAYKRLHNQTTQRLMRKLQKYRNVSVFTVPYII
ncbi:MAG: APC family permease [Clostridiales bacterium]|nr:APC family permease [Clostridiales bacterium]